MWTRRPSAAPIRTASSGCHHGRRPNHRGLGVRLLLGHGGEGADPLRRLPSAEPLGHSPDYTRSASASAGASWGNRNGNPAASAAAGVTLWLPSRISDISPNSALRANAGTGKIAGRCKAFARARVNSALITG